MCLASLTRLQQRVATVTYQFLERRAGAVKICCLPSSFVRSFVRFALAKPPKRSGLTFAGLLLALAGMKEPREGEREGERTDGQENLRQLNCCRASSGYCSSLNSIIKERTDAAGRRDGQANDGSWRLAHSLVPPAKAGLLRRRAQFPASRTLIGY